jgi:integrase
MPTPKRYESRNGEVTWKVRYRRGRGTDVVYTSETFTTRRDADDFCADVRDFGALDAERRLNDKTANATSTTPRLDSVFEEFAAWTARRVRSSRTVEDYGRDYRKAIAPTFGREHVDTITDDAVQRWVDGMSAGTVAARVIGSGADAHTQPLSAKSIGDRHALLFTIMAFAAKPPRRYITANPCSDTELPRQHKRPPVPVRPAEWAALHAALVQIDQDGADLALTLYSTGARYSEVTALTTYDVDDRGGDKVTLIIANVMRREAGSKVVRVADTKSEAGFRNVKVDAQCTSMIRRRLGMMRPGDYLFTAPRGGPMLYNNWRSRQWVKACEVANLHPAPKPHGLRHLHVADLLRAGATLPQIRTRLGHENFATTFGTYGKLIEGVTDDVLDNLAARRDGGAQIAGPVVMGELV